MKPRQKVSPAALDLVKGHEGLRRTAARLADGRWTIGYGHTRSAREGATVTADDAEALLLYDLRPVVAAVNAWSFAPLSQNQFDALVAFAFNIGLPAFRTSNVLRRVNAGEPLQAASAMDSWRRAEFEGEAQVIDALVRRRAAEKALFLTPTDGPVPAPTPVLPPRMDYGVGVFEEPALELTSPLEGDPSPTRVEPASPSDEPRSPALAAVDAVTERLQTLFPEARLPEVGGRGLSVEPDEPAVSPFPAADAPEAVAPAELAEDADDVDPARQLAPPSPGSGQPDLAPAPEADPAAPGAERWPYVFLFLGGAVLFVAGISASMRVDGVSALGVALSLAGVACIGVSVYFLLKRIDEAD